MRTQILLGLNVCLDGEDPATNVTFVNTCSRVQFARVCYCNVAFLSGRFKSLFKITSSASRVSFSLVTLSFGYRFGGPGSIPGTTRKKK
jgi:hypothetical protein